MFIYDLTIFSFLLLIDREWVHSILNFIYISITLFDVLKFIFYLSNAQHASFGFNKSLFIYVHERDTLLPPCVQWKNIKDFYILYFLHKYCSYSNDIMCITSSIEKSPSIVSLTSCCFDQGMVQGNAHPHIFLLLLFTRVILKSSRGHTQYGQSTRPIR